MINHDGQHSSTEKSALMALKKGFHSIRVTFFQKSGGTNLNLFYKSASLNKQKIPEGVLFHEEK
jgi:alpha-L-fucosidase